MKYLVIYEDETATQVDKLPDHEQLKQVKDGTLSIFRFEKGCFELAEVSISEDDVGKEEISVDWISI